MVTHWFLGPIRDVTLDLSGSIRFGSCIAAIGHAFKYHLFHIEDFQGDAVRSRVLQAKELSW